jgi:hypothetical protein
MLPSSLKSLYGDIFYLSKQPSFSYLPRGLVSLTIKCCSLDAVHLPPSCDLPRSLTALYLPSCTIDAATWFFGLPHSLLTLDFDELKQFPPLSKFPPNLTYLRLLLSAAEPPESHKALLFCLPPNLLFLDLDSLAYVEAGENVSDFVDEDMVLLPRGLIHAYLPPSKRLTTACITFLPPNLVAFGCGVHENAPGICVNRA